MDIKHKGLRELFEHERSARLPEHLVPRIRNSLGMLEAARSPRDMDVPGFRLHPLKGRRAGQWSVRVFRPFWARRRMAGSVIQSIMNKERSTRPTSRGAAASSFWRGYAASLRRIWLGRMVPAAMVAAMRKMSDQFLAIRSGLTVPPTNERNVFGTLARSNTWRRFEGRSRMRGMNA